MTGRTEIMDSFHIGRLGSTFGDNPLSYRAALAVLEILQHESLHVNAEILGKTVLSCFRKMQSHHAIIGGVRGKVPMLALELERGLAILEESLQELNR